MAASDVPLLKKDTPSNHDTTSETYPISKANLKHCTQKPNKGMPSEVTGQLTSHASAYPCLAPCRDLSPCPAVVRVLGPAPSHAGEEVRRVHLSPLTVHPA